MGSLQQNTKYKYLMSLGHFCSDINQGALSAVLPFLIAAHGYSYATAASLVMISNLVGSAVQPLIGYLSDKRSTTWAIPVGVLMAGSGIALTGFTSNFLGLCVAVVISGTGVSLFHPQAVKLVNYASDAGNRARSIGIFSFGRQPRLFARADARLNRHTFGRDARHGGVSRNGSGFVRHLFLAVQEYGGARRETRAFRRRRRLARR